MTTKKIQFTPTDHHYHLFGLTPGARYEVREIKPATLPPRLRECLELLMDNRTAAEVAKIMGITESSVDVYKTHIRKFYGVKKFSGVYQIELKRMRDEQRKHGGQ